MKLLCTFCIFLGLVQSLVSSSTIDTASLQAAGFSAIKPSEDSVFKEELLEASTKLQQFMPPYSMFLNLSSIDGAWKKAPEAGTKRATYFAAFSYFITTGPGQFIPKKGNSSWRYIDGMGISIRSFGGRPCTKRCHEKVSIREMMKQWQ